MKRIKLSRRRFLKAASLATSAVALGACGDPGAGAPDGGGSDGASDGGSALSPSDAGGAAGLEDAGASDAGDVPPEDAGAADAGPAEDPTDLWQDPFAFPNDVASGDVLADRAVLWTRYFGSGAVLLRVWEMDGEIYAHRVHEAEHAPGDGGFTHVDVTGLSPHTRYRFAFFRLDENGQPAARSAIGRFRTPPTADALVPVTFGAGCCTDAVARPFPALVHAGARDDLDFFVLGGDVAYCDGAQTLTEYRNKWKQQLATDGYRALRASTSTWATWDDHEVDNNWDPETHDPALLAAARAAFFEHHPLRRDPDDPDRIWRSYRWGRTLEVFVLDCRSERRPSTRGTPEAEYLSRAQMDWLKAGLEASDALFKVIVNSVPIANFPNLFDLASRDRWEGYGAQREEILSFIAEGGIEGVWWLSGDFHFGCVARLEADGPYAAQREILAGPSGQVPNPGWTTLTGDQFEFKTGANNYVVLRVTPEPTPVLDVAFVDRDGEEIFRRSYEA